jgi:hypothetical protein
MDYGAILTRAWQITWRWKMLWILGFLAALASGVPSSDLNYTFDGSEQIFSQYPALPGLLVGLICLGFILGIVFWVLSVMARGGLIAGVAQVEDTGDTTLARAWRVGQRRFWTLFGISILTAIPLILGFIVALVLVLVTTGGLVGLTRLTDSAETGAILASIGGVLFCVVPLCCGMIVLGIVLEQIRVYAERAAILEGLGWVDAFRRGWQVLRSNLGPTIIYWIIFLVLGLIIGAIALAVAGVVAAPFIAVTAITGGDPSTLWAIPLIITTLIGILVAAIIGAVVETFTSASWTLLYRRLTLTTAAPIAPVTPPAPPMPGV